MPATSPVTTPVAEPTDAILPDALHIPPNGRSLKVVVLPWHTVRAPVMVEGKGSMVTGLLTKQPVARV
jgi:hypothetical protein